MYKGRALAARVVDSGDAKVEVDPGDWAILKVKEPIDLPPLDVNLGYAFDFADPIFRLGNDYSKGIILSTGYVGQRTPNNLVTCLTDGHPGVSGGGVLNGDGELVGIPIGRMQGDYRFSFILPLRGEMFRKVRTSLNSGAPGSLGLALELWLPVRHFGELAVFESPPRSRGRSARRTAGPGAPAAGTPCRPRSPSASSCAYL